jgi:general secretion pathway protein G
MQRSSFIACIVLVVAAGAAVVYIGSQPIDGDGSYKWNSAKSDLEILTRAVQLSARERGRLPSESEGLAALVTGEPKYLDKVPNDPWSRPYVYRTVEAKPGFEIYSLGQDGVDESGRGDDIVAWDKTYRCADYSVGCLVTARQLPLLAMELLMLGSLIVIGYRAATAGVQWLRARFR